MENYFTGQRFKIGTMEANKTPSPSSAPSEKGDDAKGENQRRRGGRNKHKKREQGKRSFARRGGVSGRGASASSAKNRGATKKGGAKKSQRYPKFSVPVVFVGMMGCGKTTIASALASKLGQPFKDSDIEIERASNATITEIFEQYGEDYFRDGERKVIKRLMQEERGGVIATGGGAYINDETRAWINKNAICVWLRADLETIWARVIRKDTRPLLQRPDAREFLENLLVERNPIYQQAHIIVDVNNGTKMDMVQKTLNAIRDYVAEQRKLKNPKFMHKNPHHKKRPKHKKHGLQKQNHASPKTEKRI